MKTMRKDDEIIRVSENKKKIQEYLKKGYNFCSKKEWKRKRNNNEEVFEDIDKEEEIIILK